MLRLCTGVSRKSRQRSQLFVPEIILPKFHKTSLRSPGQANACFARSRARIFDVVNEMPHAVNLPPREASRRGPSPLPTPEHFRARLPGFSPDSPTFPAKLPDPLQVKYPLQMSLRIRLGGTVLTTCCGELGPPDSVNVFPRLAAASSHHAQGYRSRHQQPSQ